MSDRDLRYFIEIDRKTMCVLGHDARHKFDIDRGRQTDPERHRLFLTKGQYNKFIARCSPEKLS